MNLILSEIFGQGSNSDVIILIGLLLALLQIYAILRPNPPNHRQFADKTDVDTGFAKLAALLTKQDDQGREDRRQIYHRLNKHDNALSFIAGRLERKRDMDGDRLRKILHTEEPTNE